MSLVDRLRSIVDPMPADASVTLSVAFLRGLLEAEGDSPGDGRLLTLEETAEIVGRSASTVRTWLNTGRLDGFKLNGRSWCVRESALQEFIRQQESGEHASPTVKDGAPVDLGAWRKHVKPDKGAA